MTACLINRKSPLTLKRMIALVLNYCFGYLFVYPSICIWILRLSDIRSAAFSMFLEFMIYLVTIGISLWLAFPLLKESHRIWRYHKTAVFKKNVKLLLGMYIMTILSSMLIGMLTKTVTSNNQAGVSSSIQQFPYLMAFATMMFAPIVEEILFRGVFYRCFRSHNKISLCTFVSSAAFGFIHIYDSLAQGLWGDCWYFFVYACIGFFLCRSYEETDTIYGPILLHCLNNAIAFLSIIL